MIDTSLRQLFCELCGTMYMTVKDKRKHGTCEEEKEEEEEFGTRD